MSELKRYCIECAPSPWGLSSEEDESGEWVKYEDVQKLQTELSELRESMRWRDVSEGYPENNWNGVFEYKTQDGSLLTHGFYAKEQNVFMGTGIGIIKPIYVLRYLTLPTQDKE